MELRFHSEIGYEHSYYFIHTRLVPNFHAAVFALAFSFFFLYGTIQSTKHDDLLGKSGTVGTCSPMFKTKADWTLN